MKQNDLIIIQHGEYSDQCTVGLFRALKDLNPIVLDSEFRRLHPTIFQQMEDFTYTGELLSDFVGWLVADGYIEELDYHVLHIGVYQRLDITTRSSK